MKEYLQFSPAISHFNGLYFGWFSLSLYQPIKLRHRTCLDGVHDVDIGFHGLIVGVAGPFHHDVRSDAQGEGVDDEGAAAGVGSDQFPLGLDFVGADVALVGGDTDLFIDTGEAAQFLDVTVHRLVGVVGQGLAVLEGGVLVFLQNGLGDFVQFDGKAVSRLLGRDLNVVSLDITAAEVVDIGVPEAGEAAEEEDVPDRIQVGLGFGELELPDAGDLFLGEVDDLPLRHLQGRAEFLIVQVGVVAPVGRPVQEPTEVAQFLLDGRVLQAHQVLLVIILPFSLLFTRGPEFLAVAHISDELRQGRFRQVGELDVLLEGGQIDAHRLHLLEGGFRPGVLVAAFFQEHIIDLEEVMFLWFAFLFGLTGGLLGNRSIQPVLILLLKLGRCWDLVDGLEELKGGFHLVFDVPELVVYGQGGLTFGAFVSRLDQFYLFVPGRLVIDLATGLEVQPLGVERSAKPYLEKVVVFPVGPQLETDISLNLHGVSLLKSWPKNGPKMLKGEQRRLQRYAIESIPARVCEGVRTWFTILVLSAR